MSTKFIKFKWSVFQTDLIVQTEISSLFYTDNIYQDSSLSKNRNVEPRHKI